MRIGLGLGLSRVHSAPARSAKDELQNISHELLLPVEILEVRGSISEGDVVSALSYPWSAIFEQVRRYPDLLFDFAKNPREFEEFIAASYHKAGFKVTLTPRSGDGGKDIIAEKSGFGALRILDQCKAFKKGHVVGPNDVRAMMGTFMLNTNSSKAVVTTTSTFGKSIEKEWASFIPFRLELRNGSDLLDWLKDIENG